VVRNINEVKSIARKEFQKPQVFGGVLVTLLLLAK